MLKVKNITKHFAGCSAPILRNFNLDLESGDFCVIIGSNGSGKSTLIRIITGEHAIDNGQLSIDGRDLTDHERHASIASVVQDVNKGTIPEMTLLENLILSLRRSKKARFILYHRYRQVAIEKIKSLGIGLENYIEQPLSVLSGGQRQMIATVMAIHSRPKILLLDEHTSALDPKMQQQLMKYTAHAINQHKMTCLMVTHKLEDAIQYGNRLIMLHQGEVILDISGANKSALSVQSLLNYFHQEVSHVS